MNRDIVFVYDYFYPDYSAGGPVTSLANLATVLDCNVRILTSASYHDSGKRFENVDLDTWTRYNNFNVWYASSPQSIDKAIASLEDQTTIYLNGVFSQYFFTRILRASTKRKFDVVVAPRGMLQRGALRSKALKKRLYLFVLKTLGLLKGVRWHATDEQEKNDIRSEFGKEVNVEVIPNVPRPPLEKPVHIEKTTGTLKLVYFSLVAEKKNIGFLIDLLTSSNLAGVTLDIIGPIKDQSYWSTYKSKVATSKFIKYLGDCDPQQVNEVLSKYHLFVLPTRGENFGHAIVEAMSSYRPVLISPDTPWKDITPFNGGFAVPLDAVKWEEKLKEARNWSQQDFDKASAGAMEYFRSRIKVSALRSMYLSLFRI